MKDKKKKTNNNLVHDYSKPKIEVMCFDYKDVIATSLCTTFSGCIHD